MDHSPTAGALPVISQRLKNFGASASVVVVACAAYAALPHGRRALERVYEWGGVSFSGASFLVAVAAAYVVMLALYYATEREPGTSKSLRGVRLLIEFAKAPAAAWRSGLPRDDRVALLTTLLKGFFGPLMVMSLLSFCTDALANGAAIMALGGGPAGWRQVFDLHGFWFAMQVILFVDVLIFTVGYLVETPRLGNQIRSVDPTLLGWAAALLCYPPFNAISSAVLGWPLTDYPQFENPTVHVVLNFVLLALMAVYASASVALGFKASNLTHRGIVSRGPYRWVRHPAYTCKNLAWWIGAIPVVSAAFGTSWMQGVQTLAAVAGWSMLYVLRAVTEEDHLRGVDGDYAAYAARVRWRFIPGVV
jgi:protein-S-isoprenylcysteine O-methyltransferase Ste14